ncbi:MAG: MATE family efflux transporter, partial [Planctomycetota bacterium]
LIANLFNVVFNELFIFGGLGIPALGVEGAGYATGASRWLMLLLLIGFMMRGRYLAAGWVPWSRRSFSLRAMATLLSLGLPVMIHFGVEVWTFQAATLMAGRIGEIELAAHIVVLKIISFTFMFAWGISGAATTRVGNLLGEGDVPRARKAARAAIALGALVMAAAGITILVLGGRLPAIFSADVAVLAGAISLLPMAAGFQIFDGVQAVAAGVLRGAGKTIPAAAIGVIGFPLITLPLAYHLTFTKEMGLPGIWWAYLTGLVIVATLLVSWCTLTAKTWQPMKRRIAGD